MLEFDVLAVAKDKNVRERWPCRSPRESQARVGNALSTVSFKLVKLMQRIYTVSRNSSTAVDAIRVTARFWSKFLART